MKKLLILCLFIFVCGVLFSACSKDPGSETEIEETTAPDEAIYGTWLEDYFESGYIFNSDGTGEDTFWELTFSYTANNGKLVITFDDEMWGVTNYLYSVNGETLSLTQEGSTDTFDYYKK